MAEYLRCKSCFELGHAGCYDDGYEAAHEEAKALVGELVRHLDRYVKFYGDIGEAREALTKATKWLEGK